MGGPTRNAPDSESTAKVSICPALPVPEPAESGHKHIVDGDNLAGSQECGHQKADSRDQKKLAQFAELHALPSSWAIEFKPQENSFRLPRNHCKSPVRGVAMTPFAEPGRLQALATAQRRLCHCAESRPRPLAGRWSGRRTCESSSVPAVGLNSKPETYCCPESWRCKEMVGRRIDADGHRLRAVG